MAAHCMHTPLTHQHLTLNTEVGAGIHGLVGCQQHRLLKAMLMRAAWRADVKGPAEGLEKPANSRSWQRHERLGDCTLQAHMQSA